MTKLKFYASLDILQESILTRNSWDCSSYSPLSAISRKSVLKALEPLKRLAIAQTSLQLSHNTPMLIIERYRRKMYSSYICISKCVQVFAHTDDVGWRNTSEEKMSACITGIQPYSTLYLSKVNATCNEFKFIKSKSLKSHHREWHSAASRSSKLFPKGLPLLLRG